MGFGCTYHMETEVGGKRYAYMVGIDWPAIERIAQRNAVKNFGKPVKRGPVTLKVYAKRKRKTNATRNERS